MIIGRLIGYISLCLMFMVMGAEGLRLLEGNSEGWISLFDVVQISGIVHLESETSSGAWHDLLNSLLRLPAIFTLLFFGLLFPFMFRKTF
ncbi:hypothetical protein [Pseudemcibacter aquimaris]|uniref:hypothetical protein n=1 Tax=Pseudemcibacter aquimaris TaxID=2857064 RepID=UPI0020123C41|nr:hypothetical protein [Pseudemcibacter aquimaris]MCC3861491.1 hypothetical protein [Pseudemcibacter aquimaris]WDU58260.1 hypothetical protein KW060_13795 [Pseudemcibacter aquimaris]